VLKRVGGELASWRPEGAKYKHFQKRTPQGRKMNTETKLSIKQKVDNCQIVFIVDQILLSQKINSYFQSNQIIPPPSLNFEFFSGFFLKQNTLEELRQPV
jgi:hypothetical protein